MMDRTQPAQEIGEGKISMVRSGKGIQSTVLTETLTVSYIAHITVCWHLCAVIVVLAAVLDEAPPVGITLI
jgi:hypothetical protein